MKYMYLVPVDDEEIKSHAISLADCVALYKCDKTGIINVGNPALTSYFPAMANMYGFKTASQKGYYLILENGQDILDKPVFQVLVSDEMTIVDAVRVNSVECDDELINVDSFDFRSKK